MENKCYVVVYDYNDDDYNESGYRILGVYSTREKAQAKMKDQVEIIEHNCTFNGVLDFDHKEETEKQIYFYNEEDSNFENVMINESCYHTTTKIRNANNKNGIKMYYEFATDINKINILDSNGNYFNDLYIDDDEDVDAIIKMLEETNLEEMANFFGATVYTTKSDLEDIGTDYINIFRVKGKVFFVESGG